jgi:hypothetical protein
LYNNWRKVPLLEEEKATKIWHTPKGFLLPEFMPNILGMWAYTLGMDS